MTGSQRVVALVDARRLELVTRGLRAVGLRTDALRLSPLPGTTGSGSGVVGRVIAWIAGTVTGALGAGAVALGAGVGLAPAAALVIAGAGVGGVAATGAGVRREAHAPSTARHPAAPADGSRWRLEARCGTDLCPAVRSLLLEHGAVLLGREAEPLRTPTLEHPRP